MMEFLQTISGMLLTGSVTASLSIFLLSVLLLAAGLVLKVRDDAIRLRFLERKSLFWIETAHPHIPSPQALVTLNLCALTLLAVGLETLRGVFPFDDPYQGLNLASLFLLAAAVGTLAELRWKGASAYARAFLLGTSLAFLALALLATDARIPPLERLLLASATIFAALLAGRTMQGGDGGMKTTVVTAAVFLFWVLISALR